MEKQGFLIINKPPNITSFICIARLKRIIGKKGLKIGHAGTLDPFATGVLIVAISRTATRHIKDIMNLPKCYRAKGQLGILTNTLDKTGQLLKTDEVKEVSKESLQHAIDSFGDSYLQTPPAFSALKFQGRRLYAIARKGILPPEQIEKVLQEKKRNVNLYSLQLKQFEFPYFTIDTCVSQGTYIRSLVNDIAQKVAMHATTIELERTAIGPFSIDQAIHLDEIETIEDIQKYLIPVDDFLVRAQQ